MGIIELSFSFVTVLKDKDQNQGTYVVNVIVVTLLSVRNICLKHYSCDIIKCKEHML